MELESLENSIHYHFSDRTLLTRALTHTSYAYEQNASKMEHYERLEFLGDAVIGLAVSTFLFTIYPEQPEGDLSKRRASVVNEAQLADLARKIDLGRYLLLGKGEDQTGGREKPSILANAYEAMIAAIYLDGGWLEALKVCRSQFWNLLLPGRSVGSHPRDYKTRLQEKAQELFKETPQYEITREEGPDHNKVFESKVTLRGEVWGSGRGHSKKEAQQRAAEAALQKLLSKQIQDDES